MFEKIRKRVPASTWTDILKALHLYAEDVLQDRDLVDVISAACASPSNDLAAAFEDFMHRCVALCFDPVSSLLRLPCLQSKAPYLWL